MQATVSRFFHWLGGIDSDVVARVPRTRMHGTAAGAAVLMVGVMAFAAGGFFAREMLHLPVGAALLAAGTWAMMMVSLDRLMLTSAKRQDRTWLTVALAIPRILVAVLAGLAIAQPLVLFAFREEVARQVQEDRQTEETARVRALDGRYGDIPKLEAQQNELEQELTNGPDITFKGNSEYDAATAAYDDAQDKLAKAEKKVGCEAQGTCGTGKAGCGPVCQSNMRVVDQRRNVADKANRTLREVESRLRRQGAAAADTARRIATPELARVNSALADRRDEMESDRAGIAADFAAPVGFIDRTRALEHLKQESPAVRWREWLFALLLVAIDTSAVVMKMLGLIGRKSLPERVEEEIEDRDVECLKVIEDAKDEANRKDAELIEKEAEILVELREEALREMHQETAKVEKEVWRATIDGWANSVRSQLTNSSGFGLPQAPPDNGNGGGPRAKPVNGNGAYGVSTPPPGRRFRVPRKRPSVPPPGP
ncbi:MAG: DUF4407 domain-containing protein [Solirubrobacteraceae bacterium]|nr:DUF4407 domain-containing protein [Solirubrobacteraceae bacterium]